MDDKVLKLIYEFIDNLQLLGITQKKKVLASILYSEDNKIVQRLFSKMMSDYIEILDVSGVENGHLAFDEVKKNYFDLILLDVETPKMTGLECCAAIREYQKDADKKSKICIISANDKYDKEAYSVGADLFYHKDSGYKLTELKDIIETLLGIKLETPV